MRRLKDIDADNDVTLERATAIADNNQESLTIVDVIDDIPPILSPEISPEM